MAADLLLEDLRDGQRRGVELQRVVEHFQPAHLISAHRSSRCHLASCCSQRLRALPAILQPLAALRLLLQQAGELRQLLAQGLQRGRELLEILRRAGRHPAFLLEHQPQVARGLVQLVAGLGQRREILGRRRRFDARVARQVEQQRGGQRLAEEQAGGLRQLVRLVEDHRVAGGQQLRHALVAQHHVGKEQVMVHHHDVRLHRLACAP